MESKPGKIRLDQFLLKAGLAPSRSKAQELISEGQVEVCRNDQWSVVTSASQMIGDEKVRLLESEVLKYVSRGGRKLEGALRDFKVDVKNMNCLDLGQSTGGFTDCLLQSGAKLVVGADVGHEQLHSRLKNDPRVRWFEGVHVEKLTKHRDFLKAVPPGGFDLVVADLSFISLFSVLPQILPWSSQAILLVKPQFEFSHLGKKQLVIDENLFQDLKNEGERRLQDLKWNLIAVAESKIRGKDGNQEFFLHAKKS